MDGTPTRLGEERTNSERVLALVSYVVIIKIDQASIGFILQDDVLRRPPVMHGNEVLCS